MRYTVKNLAMLGLMLCAAAMTVMIRPSVKLADLSAPIELNQIIPSKFGDWQELPRSATGIVNPQEAELLNEIYSQTLSKTYVNSKGYRIMLSIAYGGDQSRDLQVHRPEVCYSAQGFQISEQAKVSLNLDQRAIPAMHVNAKLGARNEPITYWVRIGEKLVRGNLEQGFARLSYGLQGKIADGLLFRVSSIDLDAKAAYAYQDQFIQDLYGAVAPDQKSAIFGTLKNPSQ